MQQSKRVHARARIWAMEVSEGSIACGINARATCILRACPYMLSLALSYPSTLQPDFHISLSRKAQKTMPSRFPEAFSGKMKKAVSSSEIDERSKTLPSASRVSILVSVRDCSYAGACTCVSVLAPCAMFLYLHGQCSDCTCTCACTVHVHACTCMVVNCLCVVTTLACVYYTHVGKVHVHARVRVHTRALCL